MKTTMDIDDDILIAAKKLAIERRTTLKALTEGALRHVLTEAEAAARVPPKRPVFPPEIEERIVWDKHGVPVLKGVPGQVVTLEDTQRMLDELDEEDARHYLGLE